MSLGSRLSKSSNTRHLRRVRNDSELRNYGHRFSGSPNYLVKAIDMTLPVACSVNQRVSPTGSTLDEGLFLLSQGEPTL